MRAPEGKVKGPTQVVVKSNYFFLVQETETIYNECLSGYIALPQTPPKPFRKQHYVRVRSSALRAHKNSDITSDLDFKNLKKTLRGIFIFKMILFSTPVSNAEEVLGG